MSLNIEKENNVITVLTLNVRGLRTALKRKKVLLWILHKKVDILFFQETHLTDELEYITNSQFKSFDLFYSHGSSNSRGVLIGISKRLSINNVRVNQGEKGRFLWMSVDIQGEALELVNIYAPNDLGDQKTFYKKLGTTLLQITDHENMVIWGGDFNVTLSTADRKQKIVGRVKIADTIYDIAKKLNMVDIWRYLHPKDRQYTWSRKNETIASRLDYIFVTNRLIPRVLKTDIKVAIQTDHKAVICKLEPPLTQIKGPGIWKFNDTFLNEQDFCVTVYKIADVHIKNELGKDGIKNWLSFKTQIADAARKYGRIRAKNLRLDLKNIESRIEQFSNSTGPGKWSDEQVDTWKKLNLELETWYRQRAQRAMFISRVNWHRMGEKNNKYFLGLEKQKNYNSSIFALYKQDQVITNQSDITQQLMEYWGELYTQKIMTLDKQICEQFTFGLPKLSEAAKDDLDKKLLFSECTEALETMTDGKAPGEDGLSVAFYKKFWAKIEPIFQNLLDTMEAKQIIPEQMNTGIVRLLPKPKRDLLKTASWRPISLQGVDIKIIAKAIATRLKHKLQDIIHEDQIGFRPGKYIGETIQLITDLMHYTRKNDISAYILSLDIEKAFDSVEWQYLDYVMHKFNFGAYFMNWIKIFRSNASIKIINNGWTSPPIKITRGVRQGDPLSPYLFLLSIEPLANYIRLNEQVKGIYVYGIEFKLSQYADDTTIYTSDPETIKIIPQIMRQFASISGYNNNVNKTCAIGIGTNEYINTRIGGIEISSQPIVILGICFEPNIRKMRAGNMDGKIAKMKQVLNPWYHRNTSPMGRIHIAKTLALSILTYPIMNLQIEKQELLDIERKIYQFIWGGKRKAKIAKVTLMAHTSKGGLKAPDMLTQNSVWKMSWLNRLQETSATKWCLSIKHDLRKLGGLEYLLKCNYDFDKLNLKLRPFWQEVFRTNQKINNTYLIKNVDTIKAQIINNNQYITIANHSFFKESIIANDMDLIENWFGWNGRIKTWDYIKQKCAKLTWFEYTQIAAAIPKEWKKLLKERAHGSINLPSKLVTKKEIKRALNDERSKALCCDTRWNQYVKRIANVTLNWPIQMKLIYKVTTEVKLRFFQYKVVAGILLTNKKKCLYGIEQSNLCSFCNDEVGSIEHMYVECKITIKIYRSMLCIFNELQNTDIEINKAIMLFFDETQHEHQIRLNVLTLWTRHYIYSCFINKTLPQVKHFYQVIKSRLCMLRAVARLEGKLDIYNFNWGKWDSWLKVPERERIRDGSREGSLSGGADVEGAGTSSDDPRPGV